MFMGAFFDRKQPNLFTHLLGSSCHNRKNSLDIAGFPNNIGIEELHVFIAY